MDNLKCYSYWYIFVPNGRVEYVKIIAVSEKQAFYFFCKAGYNKSYDYGARPANVKAYKDFINQNYYVGQILGENAII